VMMMKRCCLRCSALAGVCGLLSRNSTTCGI
jgi:hypothetical protein